MKFALTQMYILSALCGVIASSVCGVEIVDLGGKWLLHKDGETKSVTVPHDWAISGPFDPGGDEHTAKLPWNGSGTYERTFVVEPRHAEMLSSGGEAYLEVDGAMASPRVSVNGQDVGGWNYGYMSFALPVAKVLKAGTNSVSIFCDTSRHKSRWYPGGGLYRSVRLKFARKDHVLPGTMFIRTLRIDCDAAHVRAEWELSESGPQSREFEIRNPVLWSVDNPHLYSLTVADETFRYGIRAMEFTADDGFHLNGKRLQLNGVCLHSDLGPLGMAFSEDAARRQLAIMKDMGVNAIRTSHNAPAPQFLDLCDEMGFVVWDECFDKWDGTSGRGDDENLEEYVCSNLRQFVRRDRNHPCVAIWSVGNEMPPASEENPHGVTKARFELFRKTVRELDPTRPVGAASCTPYLSTAEDFKVLDVGGWNYSRCYMRSREVNPSQPLVYTESCSSFSTAGHYRLPLPTGRTEWGVSAREESSYDMTSPSYGDIPDVEFNRVEKDAFLAGEFVWTGFDYLGEPSPYVRGVSDYRKWGLGDREIARSSYYGIVGLDGIPKDRFWLYRSHWNKKRPTVHIVPFMWNFTAGQRLPVMVYTSGVEGELFLNGRSLGRRRKLRDVEGYSAEHQNNGNDRARTWRENPYYDIVRKYRLVWDDVPYEPGTLEVVCLDASGAVIGRDRIETAGEAVKAVVEPDPYSRAGDSIRFYRVHAVDARGVKVADAANLVKFAIDGDGEIVAVGNADPHGHRSFADVSAHPLFAGNAVVAVRGEPYAKYTLTAMLDAEAEGASSGNPPAFITASSSAAHAECGTLVVAKAVANRKSVARAVWRTTGLGVYETYVNGTPDCRFALKPGFTHTRKRRQEFTWDVTSTMRCAAGDVNVFAARVTPGWWSDRAAAWIGGAGTNLAFRGLLEIEYEDGSRTRLATDPTWKAAYAGKVVKAAIFYGETFDNRIDESFLTDPAALVDWQNAVTCDEFQGEVTPQTGPGVCRREDLAMKGRILRGHGTKDDPYVVDFGQNHAGTPEFRFSSARGTRLAVNFGEMLDEDGSVYLANMRSCRSQADYVFSGEGEEIYSPRFSYWGYRYARIWADSPFKLVSVRSVPLTSVRRELECGKIETGDERVNRLVANSRWGMLSNYLSVPTDCPQRDERQGWAADAQVFAETAMYMADAYGFLAKWMTDLSDSLHPDGSVPRVAPYVKDDFQSQNFIGWSDAIVAVPWAMWRMSGNAGDISRNWRAMCRFVDQIAATGYSTPKGQWQYGDWLSFEKFETFRSELWEDKNVADQDTAREWWNFLGLCHLVIDAERMSKMADVLGLAADTRKYAAIAERARERLRKEHLADGGELNAAFRDMQTAHLFALKAGVFRDDGGRRKLADRLVDLIRANGNRLATGFLGTPILLDTLTVEAGSHKTAYDLLLQRNYPSWLYSVDQGATTIWERWDGYVKGRGFGSAKMNSFNHYAFGAVVSWLYKYAAGIRPGENGGFSRFVLAPVPDRRLGFVKASLRTEYDGVIESEWRYEGDVWKWRFVIPKNKIDPFAKISAEVILPDGRRETLGPGSYTRTCTDVGTGNMAKSEIGVAEWKDFSGIAP